MGHLTPVAAPRLCFRADQCSAMPQPNASSNDSFAAPKASQTRRILTIVGGSLAAVAVIVAVVVGGGRDDHRGTRVATGSGSTSHRPAAPPLRRSTVGPTSA